MSRNHRALAGLLLAGLLALAACSGTSTSTNTSTNTNGNVKTSTTPPTATSKPKPSKVPTVTVALCQSMLTVSEANQIMNPPAPATQIEISNDPDPTVGSSCLWDNGQSFVVNVFLRSLPIPQGASLQGAAQQLIAQQTAKGKLQDGKVTMMPVSNVGDQALFVVLSGSANGITVSVAALYAAYGDLLVVCSPPLAINSALSASLQGQLTQVCQKVIAQL